MKNVEIVTPEEMRKNRIIADIEKTASKSNIFETDFPATNDDKMNSKPNKSKKEVAELHQNLITQMFMCCCFCCAIGA